MTEGKEPLFLVSTEGKTEDEIADEVAEQLRALGIEVKENTMPEEQWDTDGLGRDFEVLGFRPSFVVVRRRSDGVKGLLEYTHQPRRYFNFQAD